MVVVVGLTVVLVDVGLGVVVVDVVVVVVGTAVVVVSTFCKMRKRKLIDFKCHLN